jgi:cytochrome c5
MRVNGLAAGPILTLLGALAACSPAPAPPSAASMARAAAMTPADPRLADLYAHACKACHASPASGAPLAGDRAAWAPRAAKGMPGLMKSVVGGYKGMPAGGQCFACTADDYRALVRFMADQPVA